MDRRQLDGRCLNNSTLDSSDCTFEGRRFLLKSYREPPTTIPTFGLEKLGREGRIDDVQTVMATLQMEAERVAATPMLQETTLEKV